MAASPDLDVVQSDRVLKVGNEHASARSKRLFGRRHAGICQLAGGNRRSQVRHPLFFSGEWEKKEKGRKKVTGQNSSHTRSTVTRLSWPQASCRLQPETTHSFHPRKNSHDSKLDVETCLRPSFSPFGSPPLIPHLHPWSSSRPGAWASSRSHAGPLWRVADRGH